MDASEIIRRVREIQVRTGRQVADVLAGEYVSVFKGGGVEFEEVRPYVPGDDVRSIDWNVTARTGEPFVKRYVEERQLTILLMADVSASQDFGSADRSKREATAELCALLAFSAIKNDDKVGLVLFHGGVEQYIPPRKGQKHALRVVREVLAHGQTEQDGAERKLIDGGRPTPALAPTAADADEATGSPELDFVAEARRRAQRPSPIARLRAGLRRLAPARRNLRSAREATDISRAVRFAMSVTKRRAVCFVVSDFLDENFERALMTANQKHDVIAVLVTDVRELQIPDAGLIALRDAESGQTALHDTGSAAFRAYSEEAARERIASLEKRLRRVGIDFIHIDAAGSIVEPIVKFFRMREEEAPVRVRAPVEFGQSMAAARVAAPPRIAAKQAVAARTATTCVAPLLVATALLMLVAVPVISFATGAPTDAPAADSPPAAEAPKFLEKTTERGPVKTRVRIEPAAPVIGDTVTLTVEVTAADGIDLMMPEFGQSLDRFSVREFVPKEAVDATGNSVSTQRYVLEPPLSGPQAIPPLLIEFVDHRPGQRTAPDGEESYELVTERIPFEVSSVVPAGASNELKPVREHLDPLREPGQMWPWLLALLVLAAIAAPLAWRSFQAARAEGRRRSAYDLARARLDALSSHNRPTGEDEVDNFFVELSALIRRYLEDRFELRAPELTTEEFLQVASASPDLDETHQGFLRGFLRRADMVKFARFLPPPEEIEAALTAASQFLDQTRESAAAQGSPQTGNSQSGNPQAGNPQTGDPQAGSPQAGAAHA